MNTKKSLYTAIILLLVSVFLLQNSLYSQDLQDINKGEIDFNSETTRFFFTLSETILANGFGVAQYWLMKNENMEDWEYKPNYTDLKRKIKRGWIFDTNAFRTNTLYHIYGGAGYHQIARSTGYGFFASVGWAFTGSLIWEYFGEFREAVSLNDMIFTSFAGPMLGEAFRLSGLYIELKVKPVIPRYVLMFILDPTRIANRGLNWLLFDDEQVSADFYFINPVENLIVNSRKQYSFGITIRWQ
jgi:hypothetical protein